MDFQLSLKTGIVGNEDPGVILAKKGVICGENICLNLNVSEKAITFGRRQNQLLVRKF